MYRIGYHSALGPCRFWSDRTGRSGERQQPAGRRTTELDYDPLYSDGISIDRMLYGADVFGPTGDDIGSIENVVFSDSGEALAIIAQVGGFWDIGDTHVSVPWDEVEVDRNSPSVSIPVTEENASDYSMFDEGGWFDEQTYFAQDAESLQAVDDDLVAGPSVFLASEFIGDYAYLDGDRAYGYVSDLIVAEDHRYRCRCGQLLRHAGILRLPL